MKLIRDILDLAAAVVLSVRDAIRGVVTQAEGEE